VIDTVGGVVSDEVITVKFIPLLALPSTVTTTLPVFAPLGTGVTMLVAPQLVGFAVAPPKVTPLLPCAAPKSEPPIVTDWPTAPEPGLICTIWGDDALVLLVPLGLNAATIAPHGSDAPRLVLADKTPLDV
jgi:hypothetical protein